VALAAFVVAVVVAVVVKAVKAEGEAKTAEAVAALPDKEASAITVRSITAEEAMLDKEEKPTDGSGSHAGQRSELGCTGRAEPDG
jgi:hypothetical protein